MASLFCPLLRTRAPAALLRSSIAARSISTTPRLSEILKRYTVDHEWISLDTSSSIATLGITNYAAESLGEVVFVELPAVADEIAEGQAFGAVESVKSASDILSPVNGEIVERNDAVEDKPALLNADPEGDAWLVKMKVEGGEESLEGLLDESAYVEFCQKN